MYKCLNCGNTYKFIGMVKEEGNAFIYQNSDKKTDKTDMDSLTWAFLTSDSNWKCSHHISRCFYCKSENIGQF